MRAAIAFLVYALQDRRGFIHGRIIGAAKGFLGGGGVGGAVEGFLGGGGAGSTDPDRVRTAQDDLLRRFGVPISRPEGGGITRVPMRPPTTTTGFLPGGVPGIPGIPNPFGGNICIPPWKLDPVSNRCVLDLDPGEGTGLPFGDEPRGQGMVVPTSVCVETMVCPKFADNKKGVLWMNAMTGTVVCLPRGVNGSGFGLIRKNKPRRKAFVTAAEISALRGQARTKKKAKKFAALTVQTCVTRGTRGRTAR